jgi:hypothetical protein
MDVVDAAVAAATAKDIILVHALQLRIGRM